MNIPEVAKTEADQNLGEEFEYQPDPNIQPTELVGNANLALHHHMAPPQGYDSDDDTD